jgi:hypothetical protein
VKEDYALTYYSSLLGIAAIGFTIAIGSMYASAAPAQISKIEAKASLMQMVGYKKRRTNYRDYDGEHVRAPFTSVDAGRGTHVEAPFASVHTDGRGTHVRAPFVDLWVPR